MFVVKRPFRDVGGMVTAGSIVEPADIKRFKHRVLEGHIVEVTEHNFDSYADFFNQRYGVELPPIKLDVPPESTDTNDTELSAVEATKQSGEASEDSMAKPSVKVAAASTVKVSAVTTDNKKEATTR